MSKVDLINSPIIQSPYAYLQAAGSDGSDKTVEGIQLRWDFLKTLGENHLAKGDYTTAAPYVSTLGFNRTSDFIKIYRNEFKNKYYTKLDFAVSGTTEVVAGTSRSWKYTLPVDSLTGVTVNVTVRFIDYSQYDAVRSTQTTLNTIALLNAYTGIVEVETDSKLSFYWEYDVKFGGGSSASSAAVAAIHSSPSGFGHTSSSSAVAISSAAAAAGAGVKPGYLRIESVTLPDSGDLTNKQVSCRKKFSGNMDRIISCENIQYTRFDYLTTEWKEIRIYCYEHYIAGINSETEAGKWDFIGDFALTTDDTVKTTRFMPTKVDGTGGHWPKFNDSVAGIGEFTVNKLNYDNRWRRPGFTFNPITETSNDFNGLQHFVHTYMKLSKTDERALASIPSDTVGDPTTQDISYVDMIRLVSLDYHVARILGLGHIDTGALKNKNYIYCFEYKTFAKLEAPYTTNVERTHVYMTTPTNLENYKLPAKPSLLPLSYGISVDNGTGAPTLLTDADGYAPFGNLRFININRAGYNFEKPFGPFYWEPTEYCLCDETQPVAYGLEYKEISEAAYRKPEISNDPEYFDLSGLPETMPILEGGTPKIYTHQEIEEGTHEYKAYTINWFSRVSPLSNPVQAITAFPVNTNLLPPFNFAVQLIQDEDPAEINIPDKVLVLTTQAEQTMLAAIPTSVDNTLVRVTFDWNHVHHHAHQYADYADMFYRRNEPLVVKGKIASVFNLPGNKAQITTTGYSITSTFPATTVTPTIASSDAPKFVGGFFNNGSDNYVIDSVISSGANPTFIVNQLKKIDAAPDPSNPTTFISVETFQSPLVGETFFTLENMGGLSNWDLRHSKRVYLEKFYTNAKVKLRFSPTRTSIFDIDSLAFASGNTNIKVVKPINTGLISGLTLEYSVKHEITAVAAGQFKISGNHTADFTLGKTFRVFANKDNDAFYTVNSSVFASGDTTINVAETIPNTSNTDGLIEIVVSRTVTAINNVTNTFTIAGNKISEIDFAHCENKLESDGTTSRFVVGGINDSVNFVPLLTTNPVSAAIEGTGFIQLNFQNYDLLPHPDPEVSWYKGMVRLKDVSGAVQVYPVTYIGNMTTGTHPHLSIVIQDPGFIPKSEPSNTSGADIYTLNISASQVANYHPSYKLYITTDQGLNPITGLPVPPATTNFDNSEILPVFSDPNEGNRKTYMSIRSYDVKNDYESFLSNPVVLLAQKIQLPVAPGKPSGPLYSTRPDYYGKATYTFDTKLDTTGGRVPYSVVFYRTSEDRLLDILYTKTTQDTIWNNLNALTDPKAKFDPLLWEILFSGQNTGANFVTYTTTAGSFTWPLPDNPDFYIPYVSNKALGLTNPPPAGAFVLPFVSGYGFALDQTFTVYGKPMTGKAILKSAVQDAFIPLNETPPMFSYLKTGTQTSSLKSKQRDSSGNILDPLTNDIFPMIRKYLDAGDTYVRFTDYTLDGASKSLYFYRALEMDDKFKFSDSSLPVGPVLMVNSFAPHKPQIRKLITKLQDVVANTPSSVLFEINEYGVNEKISKVEIYRAISDVDALSIRTMKKAKSINWGDPVIDDFSDVAFPLYGENLYYRLVAIREIEDVEDIILSPPPTPGDPVPTLITDFPSLPSDAARSGIVDIINPPAPKLYSENGVTTATDLQNVILRWNATCYNGTYRLQKLNESGNWNDIFITKVTDTPMQYPPLDTSSLPDFTNFPVTQILPRFDANGNAIYHRFRVQVENSSGLFNLTEFELTLAKGGSDLQEIESVLSYTDANAHAIPVLKTTDIITGASQPGTMTFTHLNNPLPAGHNTFVKVDITVTDDMNNSQTLTILSAGGSVTFDATTAPTLILSSPNILYSIKTKLYTDFAVNGAVQVFTINYLAGPCYDLKQVINIVKLTDGTHDIDPFVAGVINDGVPYPTQLKFTDISDLSTISQTFDQIDITVTDDLSNTFTKTISVIGGDVTFVNGDGGLVLDNTNPNRSYEVKVKLYSAECSTGNEIIYNVTYTYTPCDDLTLLTSIAKYTDNNSTVINPIADQTITAVNHPNGSIILQDLISAGLPSGHTFDHMDVTLEDDLGGAFIQTISTASGTVTFNHGDGGLVLDNSNPDRTYFVTLVLYTNLCSNGSSYSFTITY